MTHILPQHQDLSLAPSSLQSALQMDPAQPTNHHVQHLQQPASPPQPPRKRKKPDGSADEPASPAEPRRLRRSHEACARCRSKKIKCDSKHPRCTACATAGTACHQEDRHRQTLTPRGYTDRIELQLFQCDALLKRHIQGFDLNKLDEILAREGIDITAVPPHVSTAFQFQSATNRPQLPPPGSQPPRAYPYSPPQHMVAHPGYPHPIPMYPGAPYPPHMMQPGPYSPHIHPAFQHQLPPQASTPVQPRSTSASSQDIKGQDPQANDMSNSHALAKNFGVSAAIINDIKFPSNAADKEDLGVGSSDLASGRDRGAQETDPRDPSKWFRVGMRGETFDSSAPAAKANAMSSVSIWLPNDRQMVKNIVDIYFTRLNIHRPVFFRTDFEQTLDALYEGHIAHDDAGYVCSLYLILALGTLSELSHRASKEGDNATISPTATSKMMPADWPAHGEFFERAMFVKPYIGMSISSLQALILLHWYLYTERQGRTLWRLVGSLVRISIELGLHHDPTAQVNTFTEEECQLRIRVWSIVMIHDRGTSILLGRPLAIAPSDSNTPRPSRSSKGNVSEHFLLSSPIAEIQADIINSLYMPTRQSGDSIMRHATRIIKSMVEFRRQLPESYRLYFGGTDDWPLERKTSLVHDITEDQGLTLLKIGIARVLLLRALFNSKELSYQQRHKALVDAIVTSHNIIIVHNQLIRFPDIAFFVSPIPLHIAAMVILYGHMSQCDRLPKHVALQDVWMALDMLPRLRWRWERKDVNGGHPLISKLAEKVLDVNLRQVGPVSSPVLMSEQDWDDTAMLSPSSSATLTSAQGTPPMSNIAYNPNGPTAYGPQPRVKPEQTPQQLMDVPTGLFYPFYPENRTDIPSGRFEGQQVGQGTTQDFNQILAAAAAQPDTFPPGEGGMGVWMGVARSMQYAVPQS